MYSRCIRQKVFRSDIPNINDFKIKIAVDIANIYINISCIQCMQFLYIFDYELPNSVMVRYVLPSVVDICWIKADEQISHIKKNEKIFFILSAIFHRYRQG